MVQEETIKYSNNKKIYETNNSSNNKSNKGNTSNTGSTGVYNKFKKNSKNNFSIPSSLNNTKNKVMSKNYTKSNINSSNKKTQDKFINRFNLDNKFKNLKIEKNRFRIAAVENKKDVDYNCDIMQKIKNRFLQNIKAVTVNEINVKGNENKRIKSRLDSSNNFNEVRQLKNELEKLKNKNKENENLINNYKSLINTQKKEIDAKQKEITKIKQ
jgi:hypothetical protein